MPTTSVSGRPDPGQIVKCRTRCYLVEEVEPSLGGTRVRMACVDDDNQGAPLEVVWEHELEAHVLDEEAWKKLGEKSFDPPRQFAAFFNTTRWNCVTATDPTLFQAPFRAGIHIDAYQLEPLRMALRLPRVNLFIADDVGLGKTIEAGLIARELLLRRRISNIVVCCPPSVIDQWREEMEQRFGLTFEVYDREYVRRIREERGFSVNPWETHPRFIISERLLIDDAYRKPLVDWLANNPEGAPTAISGDRAVKVKLGTLLIYDEAHHAAPASGNKYAKDTKTTGAIRDIAPRFEHRLFLSATPHNGHSNSYSALLNILDDSRFTPGIQTLKDQVRDVVIRRLKEDLRKIGHAFPEREVVQVLIKLPEDAPELVLPKLLEEYKRVYRERFRGASKLRQQQKLIEFSVLRQRLFSSLPAFARTLAAHRAGVERRDRGQPSASVSVERMQGLRGLDPDDENALDASEVENNAAELMELASSLDSDVPGTPGNPRRERELLDQMQQVAEANKYKADGRVLRLIEWLKANCCPAIGAPENSRAGGKWSDTRVIIFTEYEETLSYLRSQLADRIEGTPLGDKRIEVYRGSTGPKERARIKRAFMALPSAEPVRILLATDAAREGLNLQAHCSNLFHFDVPWNPGRLEQRNGRIDRKLQPAPTVFCHYFVHPQRKLDRVLAVLVQKTERITRELGSVGKVLEPRLQRIVENAMGGDEADIDGCVEEIEKLGPDKGESEAAAEELEATRKRTGELQDQIRALERHLDRSRKQLGLDSTSLRRTVDCALELIKEQPLKEIHTDAGSLAYELPSFEAKPGRGSWADTMDTLRLPPKDGERDSRWRVQAPIRPLVFDPPAELDETRVHVHLEHRIVKRLLGRFLAQGFIHNDLSRTCLGTSRDEHTRVVLLGRVALYGKGAARLHEEIVCVSARWSAPATRGRLAIEGVEATRETYQWLQETLGRALGAKDPAPVPEPLRQQLHASIPHDLPALRDLLKQRAETAVAEAVEALEARGLAEAKLMRSTLEITRGRIQRKRSETETIQISFNPEELEEQRTLELNRRYWKKWLETVDQDIDVEPRRVQEFYKVASTRIEPLGIVYLVGARAQGGS